MRVPVILLFAAIGTIACLSPAQNDTWWHLRSGQEMWTTHHLLFEDRFSFTAYGQFFWNHSWLSQIVFYALYKLGGLPLVTLSCAAAILTAWIVTWRLLSGAFTDRVILVALAISSATVTWSVRPQAFSILLVPVVVWLASEDRWRALPPIFVLWANLHAGFVLGLALVAAAVLAALVWDRDRFWRRCGWATICGIATLATPIGVRNWTEVLASMARSRANVIQEWQPPALPPEHFAFWGLAALLVVLVTLRWRKLETPSDRVLVAAAIVVLPMAVRSLRNVPAFTMVVCPAASRLMFGRSSFDTLRTNGPTSGAFDRVAAVIAVLAGVAVIVAAWSTPWAMLGWRPMSADAARAIAACPAPVYNAYAGGGPIIWFVPNQRVFVDSRQDPFPVPLIQAAAEVERTGNYPALFAAWHLNCAALAPDSPTVPRLSADGWTTTFKDLQWVVLERPHQAPTAATPSPAP